MQTLSPEVLGELIKQGMGATLSVGCFILVVYVVRFILQLAAKHMEKTAESLVRVNQTLEDNGRRNEEAFKYVREEHKQMIETLGRINGYRK